TVADEMGGDWSSDECDEEEDRDEYPSGQRELVLLEPQPDARPVAARLDSRPAVVLLDVLRCDEVVCERRPHTVRAPGGNGRERVVPGNLTLAHRFCGAARAFWSLFEVGSQRSV